MVGELGDDLEMVNRSRRSSVPVDEDDDDGVTAGLPVSCVLMETTYATSAELPDKWGGKGRPVVTAAANGGDGCARWLRAREAGEGRESSE